MNSKQKLLNLKERLLLSLSNCVDAYTDINNTAQELTNSDRSTFFIFNPQTNILESYIAQGLSLQIHINLGEGIVGSCAQHKQAIIENDVDSTKIFCADIDLGSGYVTRNTLVVPILDKENKLLGVIQVLNKSNSNYDEEDETLLLKLSELSFEYINR